MAPGGGPGRPRWSRPRPARRRCRGRRGRIGPGPGNRGRRGGRRGRGPGRAGASNAWGRRPSGDLRPAGGYRGDVGPAGERRPGRRVVRGALRRRQVVGRAVHRSSLFRPRPARSWTGSVGTTGFAGGHGLSGRRVRAERAGSAGGQLLPGVLDHSGPGCAERRGQGPSLLLSETSRRERGWRQERGRARPAPTSSRRAGPGAPDGRPGREPASRGQLPWA